MESGCGREPGKLSRGYNGIVDLRDQLRDFFRREAGLAAAWLFGSVARGVDSKHSDVDLAVLYEGEPRLNRYGQPFELEGDLQKLLGRDVDVIVMNRAPVDLVHRVLRDGELLFEGNRSCRIAFEVKSRNEYFDLLPYLRRYRKGAMDRALEERTG